MQRLASQDIDNITFDGYQFNARQFAVDLGRDQAIFHGVLGLCGEAGEIAEKAKKWIRDGKPLDPEDIKKELGDVLWYIAYTAGLFGFNLSDVAGTNYAKLSSRKERNVLSGSGDDR
jgi:NTP pyrophosphatase (non-canonical NTP hydrolase)